VLLVVCGLSPQVVSETVFALARTAPLEERAVPTEIRVVTTATGAVRVGEAFLGPRSRLRCLIDEHGLPPIEFGAGHVHIVTGEADEPLADIRTAEDNGHVADALTDIVRDLTADPACALHVSLAGGRKTMGFYAGYALSLFGRGQDRLSHVLVPPPFEFSTDFYYPAARRGQVRVKDGDAWADAADAKVELALVPFVRLRHGLPQALLEGRYGFAAVVAAASASAAPPRLVLDAARRFAMADSVRIPLTPMQVALLAALAHRAHARKPPLAAPSREVHDDEVARELLADSAAALGGMNVPVHFEQSIGRDCSGNKLSPHWSDIRKLLRTHLAPGRDALYFDSGPSRRDVRYRIPLEPAAIDIVRPPGHATPATASLPSGRSRRPARKVAPAPARQP
jgi:CRISPR-associated protein (TIGR02584 family)